MDLTTVDVVRVARRRDDLVLGPGAVALAGGTWLYSEPQPGVRELVDLTGLGWPPVEVTADGVTVAATCTVRELVDLAPVPGWCSQHLVGSCARALVASVKVWDAATVGGNICTALPAGAMTSLAVALDATAVVWTADGGERRLPVADLVTGVRTTALAAGEVLRAVHLPAAALAGPAVFRRASLTPHGRSGTVVIGRRDPAGAVVVSLTAGVVRPHRLRFDALPDARTLRVALDAVDDWYDDVHGAPAWRRAMSLRLAEEVRTELAATSLAPDAPTGGPGEVPA